MFTRSAQATLSWLFLTSISVGTQSKRERERVRLLSSRTWSRGRSQSSAITRSPLTFGPGMMDRRADPAGEENNAGAFYSQRSAPSECQRNKWVQPWSPMRSPSSSHAEPSRVATRPPSSHLFHASSRRQVHKVKPQNKRLLPNTNISQPLALWDLLHAL